MTLIVGLWSGGIAYYDDFGYVEAVDQYPHYDGGDGDYGYSAYNGCRDNNLMVLMDEDWPLLSFVNSKTGELIATDMGNRRNDYYTNVFFVGNEVWVFGNNFVDVPINIIRKFTRAGIRVDDDFPLPMDSDTYRISAAASNDNHTFYILTLTSGFSENATVFKWTIGDSTVTPVGMADSAIIGPHDALNGEVDVRQITMHNDELVVSTYNTSAPVGDVYHDHAAIVRIDVSSPGWVITDNSGVSNSNDVRWSFSEGAPPTVSTDGTGIIFAGENDSDSIVADWTLWQRNKATGEVTVYQTGTISVDFFSEFSVTGFSLPSGYEIAEWKLVNHDDPTIMYLDWKYEGTGTVLSQIARYEIGDLTLSGDLAVLVPRFITNGHDYNQTLTFAVGSDGKYIWTGDFLNGEIWRINPMTDEIILWNHQLWGFGDTPIDLDDPDNARFRRSNGPIGFFTSGFSGDIPIPPTSTPEWRSWPVQNIVAVATGRRANFVQHK